MRKIDYAKGFWGVTIACSLLTVGLVGVSVTGAVNSSNRDDQIATESHEIHALQAKLDDAEDSLRDAQGAANACAKAYGYAANAYDALRDGIVNNTLDIATINRYIQEAKDAGCEPGTGS